MLGVSGALTALILAPVQQILISEFKVAPEAGSVSEDLGMGSAHDSAGMAAVRIQGEGSGPSWDPPKNMFFRRTRVLKNVAL